MGSGLILGGIGKGIAEAGAAYAGGMSKMAEFEMQQEREAQREERQLRLADKMETQKQEKAATTNLEISKRADAAPLKREAEAVVSAGSKVEGESPVMNKEEVLQLIKDNPQYREIYRKAGIIGSDKMDPEVRRAMDEEAAAREIGAPATTVESFRKAKVDQLARIREENKEKRSEAQFQALLPIRQQTADAATARAAGAGSGKYSNLSVTKLDNQAETLRKAMKEEMNPERKAKLQIDFDEVLAEQKARRQPKTSDNAPPAGQRPPLGSFVRP